MLESSLLIHNTNKLHYNKFIDEFDKNKIIPFIGAGASVPTGELDWDKLFDAINKKYKTNVKVIKDNNDCVDYPKSFSKIYSKLTDKSHFFKEVFICTDPTQTSFTGLHAILVKEFKTFLTTNYDTPIESAYNIVLNKEPIRHYFSPYHNPINNDSIIYLHGHKDINFAILKQDDYDYFYPTISNKAGIPILENFIERIYSSNILMFIGFSFNDNYITEYLTFLSRKYTNKVHYWIISETNNIFIKHKKAYEYYINIGNIGAANAELDRFFNSYIDKNIYPIIYKDDRHVFIEKLLEAASKTKTQLSITSEPISGDIR